MKQKKYEYVKVDDTKHRLMKSLLPFKENIQAAVNGSEYSRNVFVMIKYRDNNASLRDFILETLESHGFKGVLAIDTKWSLTEGSVVNPLAVLYCCKYGIAIFDEPEKDQIYNPNVAYELGIMHYQGKNCLILIRDEIKQKKPFDLLYRLHAVYKKDLEIRDHIRRWVEEITQVEERARRERLRHKDKRKVVIAVVRKKNKYGTKYLLTKRRDPEGDFLWGFPAKTMTDDANVKKYLPPACVSETGIKPKILKNLGGRLHPDTNRVVEYWLCDYVKGRINILDPSEIADLKWVSGKKAQELITSDIYQPIRDILNGRNHRISR